MRKSRFTKAQIIGGIEVRDAELPTVELCRKHGLSPATFYRLKAKYGGMDLSGAKRLRQLEDKNSRLKRWVADVMLDNVVLKELAGKALTTPMQRRDAGAAGNEWSSDLSTPSLRPGRC